MLAKRTRLSWALLSGLIVVGLVSVSMVTHLTATVAATSPLSVAVSGNHLVDGSGNTVVLRGVNLSGTEFSCIQGGSPTSRGWSIFGGQPMDQASTYSAIAAWHANVVRVPLNEDCWLGINGVNPAFGGAAYRAAIQNEVSLIHQAGLYAVLDLHWSSPGPWAAYWQQPIADADHSIDFWRSVAATFKSDPANILDLYNEPFMYWMAPGGPDQWTCWLQGCSMTQFVSNGQVGPDGSTTPYSTNYTWQTAGMQALVDAVRSTGATQPILVNGIDWANDLSGWLAHEPMDPAGQLVAGWHSYPAQPCAVSSCWTSVISPIAQKVPVLVGETGDSVCQAVSYDNAFLPWADANGVSYLGWTWNVWQNCDNVLIKDWSGTPTANYGTFYHDHLMAVGSPVGPPPSPSPSPSPNPSPSPSPNPSPSPSPNPSPSPSPPPGTMVTVDTAVSTDAQSGTAVTPAFDTAGDGETLLAFVASDGPGGGWQSMAVSGGGLNWSRLARANTQSGVAEIWKAIATTALRGATVTSTGRKAGYHQSLTVVAYVGKTATGAVAVGGDASGAPSLTVTTTNPNAYVVGVGNDWDNAAGKTPGSGQVLLHQWADTTTLDTYWVQATAPAAAAGSLVTVDDAPTSDQWNLAAVEVYPAG